MFVGSLWGLAMVGLVPLLPWVSRSPHMSTIFGFKPLVPVTCGDPLSRRGQVGSLAGAAHL